MTILYCLFVSIVVITVIYKVLLSIARRRYDITFEGKDNTLIEANSHEIGRFKTEFWESRPDVNLWRLLAIFHFLSKWL
ncbi:MAG: hypothetical protein AAF391_11715, partial [Bacteroidota bacterium]